MKSLFHIGLIVTVAFLLTGCFDKNEGITDTDVSISFTPVVKINSRALSTSTVYPEEIPFGVWAYTYRGNVVAGKPVVGEKIVMENALVTYRENQWLPEETAYWPARKSIIFFAYSPYSPQMHFTGDKGIQFKDVNLLKDSTTYLFTLPISDCDREQCRGLVPVTFLRALSRVEFRMRATLLDDRSIRLKGLRLEKLAYRGDFSSLPYPSWTLDAARTDMECCPREMPVEEKLTQIGVYDFMPQQLHSKLTVVVDVYDGRGVVIDEGLELSTSINVRWQPGEYMVYTLNISTYKVMLTTDILE